MNIDHFNFFNNKFAVTNLYINMPYPIPLKLQLASLISGVGCEVNHLLSCIYQDVMVNIEKKAGFLMENCFRKRTWQNLQLNIFALLREDCIKVTEIFIREYSTQVLRDIPEQLYECLIENSRCNGTPTRLEVAIHNYRPDFMDTMKLKAREMTRNWNSKITDELIRHGLPVIPVKPEPIQIEDNRSSF